MSSYPARGTDPGSNPQPDRRRDASVREAVEAAGRSVLEDPGEWEWHALEPGEAETVMDRLTDVAAGTGPVPDPMDDDCGSVVSLAMRLSDLLRAELLDDPRGLADAQLLDVVRRIEACRVQLEPRTRQDLAYVLTGANALDLVVEFAHDLRSPLTSIMFLSETLRKGQSGEINDVQREQLGIVYSAALGMVGLANDLMDLAGSEADEEWGQAQRESFSAQELVEVIRDTVAPMAEQKRLDISFYTPRHDTRLGHPVLLSRVLLNLMTNAIKFTDEGRVEVVIEEKHGGDTAVVSVSDTGRGMTEDAIEELFTLFGRSHSRTGYHFSGTGLGLNMCQRMVEIMGSSLQVESTPGEGTRFFFELELPRA